MSFGIKKWLSDLGIELWYINDSFSFKIYWVDVGYFGFKSVFRIFMLGRNNWDFI